MVDVTMNDLIHFATNRFLNLRLHIGCQK